MKITIDRKVLEQARYLIERTTDMGYTIEFEDSIGALSKALAQPAAQPTIDLSRLEPFVSGLGKAILREMKEELAAKHGGTP
jgi:hypothetical protein